MKDYLRRVGFVIGAVIEEDRNGRFLIYPPRKAATYQIEKNRIIKPVRETINNPISNIKIDTYEYIRPIFTPDTPGGEVFFSGYLESGEHDIYFDKPIAAVNLVTVPSEIEMLGSCI